jgi:hypothetical protein
MRLRGCALAIAIAAAFWISLGALVWWLTQ